MAVLEGVAGLRRRAYGLFSSSRSGGLNNPDEEKEGEVDLRLLMTFRTSEKW
jgi:hypothetical protein